MYIYLFLWCFFMIKNCYKLSKMGIHRNLWYFFTWNLKDKTYYLGGNKAWWSWIPKFSHFPLRCTFEALEINQETGLKINLPFTILQTKIKGSTNSHWDMLTRDVKVSYCFESVVNIHSESIFLCSLSPLCVGRKSSLKMVFLNTFTPSEYLQ